MEAAHIPVIKTGLLKKDSGFDAGELVVVKIEGHIWWPSLVCGHDASRCTVNVQYFGKPELLRTNVIDRIVKPFTSEDCKKGGMFFSSYPDWKYAVQEAENALIMSKTERLTKFVDPSDDDSYNATGAKVSSDVREVEDESSDDRSHLDIQEQAELFFGHQEAGQDQLKDLSPTNCLIRLLLSNSDDLRLYAELAEQCKDTNWLLERFQPVLDYLLSEVKGYQEKLTSLSEVFDFEFPKFLRFFTRNENLASVLFMYENDLMKSSKISLIGNLMTLHPDLKLFSDFGLSEHAITKFVTQLQSGLYEFFSQLLPIGNYVLSWIGEILHLHRHRVEAWNSHRLTSSLDADVFLTNVQDVLFKIFKPHLEDETTMLNIQHSYWWAAAENKGLHTNAHMIATHDKYLIPSDSREGPAIEYNQCTEYFGMIQQCITFGFGDIYHKFSYVDTEVMQIQKRYQTLSRQGLQDTEAGLELQECLQGARSFFNFYKNALIQSYTLDNSKIFAFTANFLIHTAMTTVDNLSPLTINMARFPPPPADTSGALLKYIPEFLVQNLCVYIFFLSSIEDSLFEKQIKHLGSIFDVSLCFISNPHFIQNTFSRMMLVRALQCLFPYSEDSEDSEDVEREILLNEHVNAKHVAQCLMEFVVGCGPARQNLQINDDTISVKKDLCNMFRYLSCTQLHSDAVMALVANAKGQLQATPKEPLLLHFMYILANDARCYLEEALKAMKSRDTRSARDINRMTRFTIFLLAEVTTNFLSDINNPVILALIAVTVDRYLLELIGQTKVEWEADFGFYRQSLLSPILYIYQSMVQNNIFLRIVSRCKYSRANLVEAAKYLPENTSVDINVIKNVAAKIEAVAAREEADRKLDHPFYVDPLTGVLIRDPVRVPSRMLFDLHSIIDYILKGYSQPMTPTGSQLTIEMIRHDIDLRVRTEVWLRVHRNAN